MTTAQVVETSVTVHNNSPIQDYVHPENQTQPTFEMTAGFKPLTIVPLFFNPTNISPQSVFYNAPNQISLTQTQVLEVAVYCYACLVTCLKFAALWTE